MWIQKVTGGGIGGLAYSPDGVTLYTCDGLYRVAAWDVATRTARPLGRVPQLDQLGLYQLVVSPDGKYLVALQVGTSVALGTTPESDCLFGRVPWPSKARFVPGHGARLAVLNEDCDLFGYWDLMIRQMVGCAKFAWDNAQRVRSFDFAPDGRSVVLLGEAGEVTLADYESGEVLTRVTVPQREQWLSHVRFSPDGATLLLFTPHQVVLWDIARAAVRTETHVPDLFGSTFALNPTLPVFAALNRERLLTLYSLDSGKALRSLDFALGRSVRCVAFAPDGLTCAVGGSNKQFAVFDVDL